MFIFFKECIHRLHFLNISIYFSQRFSRNSFYIHLLDTRRLILSGDPFFPSSSFWLDTPMLADQLRGWASGSFCIIRFLNRYILGSANDPESLGAVDVVQKKKVYRMILQKGKQYTYLLLLFFYYTMLAPSNGHIVES